jgi:hypothetical protein
MVFAGSGFPEVVCMIPRRPPAIVQQPANWQDRCTDQGSFTGKVKIPKCEYRSLITCNGERSQYTFMAYVQTGNYIDKLKLKVFLRSE